MNINTTSFDVVETSLTAYKTFIFTKCYIFSWNCPYYKHLHGRIKGYLQTNNGSDNCHKQIDTKLLRGGWKGRCFT